MQLANQERVLPIDIFCQVLVNIEGFHTFVDFEVINVVDDMNPYPALLGIYWAKDNQVIINFKKRILSFEDLPLIH